MTNPPEDYRYCLTVPIRYRDMDTLGHVNNVVYLTYLEQARIEYINHLGLWDGQPSEQGLILAKSTVEYRLPLAMSDRTVDVWTRVSRLGNRSFDMAHRLICQRDGQPAVAAEASIVMVVYNYVAGAAVPIPADWRDRLINYEPALSG
jgi:acyl-CoA thioester hydrolase